MRTEHSAQAKLLYNRARWKALRLSVFARDNYICQRCGGLCNEKIKGDGYSPVCDHKTPHNNNLEMFYDITNLQTLHKSCHDQKTLIEDRSSKAHSFYPDWIPKPACEVILVTGASGSGKSTWAKAQATAPDTVIDLDDCFFEVCGIHGHERPMAYLHQAIRLRNLKLSQLSNRTAGKAYVIIEGRNKEVCDWWCSLLLATVMPMQTTLDDILSRDIGDRRKARARAWFANNETSNTPKAISKSGHDATGRPTNPLHPWNRTTT